MRAEYATFVATHLFNLSAAIILQLFNLGSSSVFTVFSVGSLFALWLNTVLNGVESRQRRSRHIEWANIHLTAYFVAQFVPLVVGAEMSVGLLTIFVPLTGRLGEVCRYERGEIECSFSVGCACRAYNRNYDRCSRLLDDILRAPNCSSSPTERLAYYNLGHLRGDRCYYAPLHGGRPVRSDAPEAVVRTAL